MGRLVVEAPGHLLHQRPAGEQFCLAVGQHGLDQLKLTDGLAELLAFAGVGSGFIQDARGRSAGYGRDVQATAVQHLHRGLEALTRHAADDVGRRHARVVQDHVAGHGAALAHLLVLFAKRQTGRIGRNDEGRNAPSAGASGARHQREGAGARRVGDEALGAVEHIVVAVGFSAGLERSGIGAGVGLGQRKRHDQFAARDPGQVVGLLLGRAVHQDAL